MAGALDFIETSTTLRSLLGREDAEPLLILDRANSPRRLFLVRYVTGREEFSRPIFKSELTGYDCETQLMYPTQTTGLNDLQALMEARMYGSPEVPVSRIKMGDLVESIIVRTLVSDNLIHELSHLYEYAW